MMQANLMKVCHDGLEFLGSVELDGPQHCPPSVPFWGDVTPSYWAPNDKRTQFISKYSLKSSQLSASWTSISTFICPNDISPILNSPVLVLQCPYKAFGFCWMSRLRCELRRRYYGVGTSRRSFGSNTVTDITDSWHRNNVHSLSNLAQPPHSAWLPLESDLFIPESIPANTETTSASSTAIQRARTSLYNWWYETLYVVLYGW